MNLAYPIVGIVYRRIIIVYRRIDIVARVARPLGPPYNAEHGRSRCGRDVEVHSWATIAKCFERC